MASELRVNTLKDASGNNSIATSFVAGGSTKAWTHLNGTGTIAIQDSFNTSSATDRSTGRYEFNRTNNMVNRLYTGSGSCSLTNGDGSSAYVTDSFADYQVQGPFSTSVSTSGVYNTSFNDYAYVANNVNGDLA